MAEIRNYTAEDMKTEKLAENHLTLVDFWATWCGPCRMIAPIVEELACETQDVAFGKVNVDEESEAAVALGIQAIPTLILFKDGQPVDKAVGVQSKEALKAMIDRNR